MPVWVRAVSGRGCERQLGGQWCGPLPRPPPSALTPCVQHLPALHSRNESPTLTAGVTLREGRRSPSGAEERRRRGV